MKSHRDSGSLVKYIIAAREPPDSSTAAADRRPESEALFRDAYARDAALLSAAAFAESILPYGELSSLYDACKAGNAQALRMLIVPEFSQPRRARSDPRPPPARNTADDLDRTTDRISVSK